MKTFPNWRQVGRVMRWARQQDGNPQGPFASELAFGRKYAWGWRANGQIVALTVTWGIGYTLSGRGPHEFRLVHPNALEILRVLAALQLIPAELAEEKVTCLRCGRELAANPITVGWEHVDHDAWLNNRHRAEAAGNA